MSAVILSQRTTAFKQLLDFDICWFTGHPFPRLQAYSCDSHALTRYPTSDRGWGHLPEFWADAGSLDLNPANNLCTFHPYDAGSGYPTRSQKQLPWFRSKKRCSIDG
jgi:hypothetical protein